MNADQENQTKKRGGRSQAASRNSQSSSLALTKTKYREATDQDYKRWESKGLRIPPDTFERVDAIHREYGPPTPIDPRTCIASLKKWQEEVETLMAIEVKGYTARAKAPEREPEPIIGKGHLQTAEERTLSYAQKFAISQIKTWALQLVASLGLDCSPELKREKEEDGV